MRESTSIFGNPISPAVQRRAKKSNKKYARRFGVDPMGSLGYGTEDTPILYNLWGSQSLVVEPGNDRIALDENPLIIGTIRMGYGHFRISMAIASAAAAGGFTPYWLDFHAQRETTAGRVIGHLNDLYSLGSRLSQKFALFNRFYWEPLNSQGFRRLSYNAVDQEVARLFAPVCAGIPEDTPFIATHAWPAQAAVHRGIRRVVNVIPDNWPMALHLAQGSIHTVQTHHAYWGYRSLHGMGSNPKEILKPMPAEALEYTGHYIDHELLTTLEADCANRIARARAREPLRLLMTIGGAGAQAEFYLALISKLKRPILQGRIQLLINAGDHQGVRNRILEQLPELGIQIELTDGLTGTPEDGFDGFTDSTKPQPASRGSDTQGPSRGGESVKITPKKHQLFYSPNIFSAVYTTNLLMPHCDVLVTKPSELAYYPIPKLLVKRIGGHEAWGAIHGAEVGDSTPECPTPDEAAAKLELMLADSRGTELMNTAILAAFHQGIYNGAYRVIELATQPQ